MVRDLARDLGKEVELRMEGKEIECDRTLLEEVSEPLVHLLRNALDHGIESPAERRAQGKPAAGLLRLMASREKNQVLIEIRDDGRGIDSEKVRQSALAKGYLSQTEASMFGEADAVRFILMPGFSTAEKVTSLSGRGVGLDVVKTKVESFGGGLKIESRKGQGTAFHLRLPLTLAIIQALMVRVGGEIYAVPVANTVEAVEYGPADLRVMQNQEVVLLREQVLPVLRLGALLETPGGQGPLPGTFTVLVAETADRRVGLMVDEVIGQQEIAIKNLGGLLKGVRGFGGVTVLGDGRIALILDIPSLI